MATQPNPDYILNSCITKGLGEPLEGLIVRAYDQDPKMPGNLLPLQSMSSAGTDHIPRGG